MDCKKALVEADGDMDKAVEVLREKGLSKAAKKAGRIAAEGLVSIAFNDDATEAAVIEVNSETDFCAKNAEFVGFVDNLSKLALTGNAAVWTLSWLSNIRKAAQFRKLSQTRSLLSAKT